MSPASGSRDLAVDAALLAMTLFWAMNMVVLKALLVTLPPPALSAVRFLIVSIASVAILAAQGGPWRFERRDWLRVAGAAVLGISLYQVLFMEGLQRTTAFASSLLQGTEPLFALLLLRVTGAEVVAPRQWAGVLVAFAGAVVFFLQEGGRGSLFAFGLGDFLNLAGAATFAFYGLLSGGLFARYPGRLVMAYTMGLGTIPLWAWAHSSIRSVDWTVVGPAAWAGIFFSSLVPVFLGFWIWNWAIVRKGLAHASLYIFIEIVMTGVFAWIFLGERFGPLRLAGAAVILAGTHHARARQPPPTP